jgi:hypothetical protein
MIRNGARNDSVVEDDSATVFGRRWGGRFDQRRHQSAAQSRRPSKAEELRSLSDRPARMRIMTIFGDDRSGLTINARIAARTPAEHRAQEGLGTRCIPWDELDARAGEIVGLVDEVAGEVTLAVRNAPPVPRPSRSEDDLELAAFDDLIDEIGQTITQSALSVLEQHLAKQVSRELGSEAAMLYYISRPEVRGTRGLYWQCRTE